MIHKEGIKMLLISFITFGAIYLLVLWYLSGIASLIGIVLLLLWLLFLQFFRNPSRTISVIDNAVVYAPADGKVVIMEESFEPEYFNEKRMLISIFMSPLNVHVNRNPIGGIIKYFKYHPGKYLVAWHPKSSIENERTTVVIDSGNHEILFRQIAGALARRICTYIKKGDKVVQGNDMGFIKFGSRVDIYLPLDSEICVTLNQKVQGNLDIIAKL